MKSFPYSFALSTLATILVPQIAFAQWVPIAETSSGQVYINGEVIEIANRYVKFWERRLWNIPTNDGAAVTDSQTIMDCNTGNWQTFQIVEYNTFGKIIYNSGGSSKAPRETFRTKPGTVGSDIYNFVCQ